MQLPMLRFVSISSTLLLFAVALMPDPASSGEFRLDTPPGKLTFTQLIEFNKVMGVADQQGKRTHPRWWGITEWDALPNGLTKEEINELVKKKESPIPFHAEKLNICKTNKACLRMTDLKLEFQLKVSMARLEWKHEWPDKSSCAQEWGRLVKEIEAHERQHAKDAEDIVKNLNANILKRQEFRTTSGETEASALAEMERLLQQAIELELDVARKESRIKEEETHRNYPIKDPDYTQCKSYSFEGLNIHWKAKVFYDNGMVWVSPGEMILESEGSICGNPLETDQGYVLWGVDNKKPNKVRVPWSKYRELQSDPIKAKAELFGFPRFLSTNPPQFEWIVPFDYMSTWFRGYGISGGQLIPPTPTARVPAIVSEEPRGCEESQPEVKPVSAVPQTTKRLTRFTPLPTTGLSRCE